MPPIDVPLSLLDRSRTRAGEPDALALLSTIERARLAEELGYHRFWVAEHHAVPGIGSGSPAVLAAAVAARTSRIRVGSGGVMLPNHAPLVVAEQFAVLESLHPGRVDLGLGRSLGFSAPVREALGATEADPDRFLADVDAVRAFLGGRGPVTATPRLAVPPPIFLLAGGRGLSLAGRAGLPVAVGGPALEGAAALDAYRRAVRATGGDPYVIASVTVMVADSEDRARDLLLPEAWAMAASRTTGAFPPLEDVAAVRSRTLTSKQRATMEQFLAGSVYGTAGQVAERLGQLVRRTGADEVMATTSTFERADQARADAALASLFAS
ncbi:MsnO8 family LLM class oxidoreductase [Georgenia sp. EYE_87]|uniref:MsnO8 family LLM class oxidoreductase n=1 Tax=Georgenia sp. EYE_87 TaxID=2853448 RepID=UPI0020053707|nr:MsnO8 family LLM class oxidoreductase [Georgenia sp. EYE_87]MCK6209575.1 MsnO8 family LLM class oxidoreductase [Georgenia sp. EYE_87]